MTAYVCPKCAKRIDQPANVSDVAHRCPKAPKLALVWLRKVKADA